MQKMNKSKLFLTTKLHQDKLVADSPLGNGNYFLVVTLETNGCKS